MKLDGITYELLKADEFPKIAKLFRKYGDAPKNPGNSIIYVAKDPQNEIIGWIIYEQIVHGGQGRVLEPFRRRGILTNLSKFARSFMVPGSVYYAFSSNDIAEKYCEKEGLTKLDHLRVWLRKI